MLPDDLGMASELETSHLGILDPLDNRVSLGKSSRHLRIRPSRSFGVEMIGVDEHYVICTHGIRPQRKPYSFCSRFSGKAW